MGGFIASVHKDAQPHVFEYDPAADSWRLLSPLHSSLGSVAVTVLDDKIDAVGGRNPAGQTVVGGRVYLAAGSLKPGSGQVTDQLIVFSLP